MHFSWWCQIYSHQNQEYWHLWKCCDILSLTSAYAHRVVIVNLFMHTQERNRLENVGTRTNYHDYTYRINSWHPGARYYQLQLESWTMNSERNRPDTSRSLNYRGHGPDTECALSREPPQWEGPGWYSMWIGETTDDWDRRGNTCRLDCRCGSWTPFRSWWNSRSSNCIRKAL